MSDLFSMAARVLLVLVLANSTSTYAQTHVILTNFGSTPNDTGRITDIDLASGAVNWAMSALSPPLEAWVPYHAPVISSDGRLAVWMAGQILRRFLIPGGFVARDLVSGEILRGSLPTGFARDFVGHPRRFVVFAATVAGLFIIEPSGFRKIPVCEAPEDMSITLDGSELFVACEAGRVVIVDTQREAITREIAVAPTHSWSLIEVNGDGSRLVTLGNLSPSEFSLAVHDGHTGQLVAQGSVPTPPACCTHAAFGSLTTNADRTEIYAGFLFNDFTNVEAGETRIYGLDTLTMLGTIPIPLSSVAFTPDGRKAVAIANWESGELCSALLVDAQKRAVEGSVYSGACGYFPGVAIAAPPLAPANLSVTRNNRRVTLGWELPAHSPAATTYLIEVSFQSGGPIVASLATGSSQTTLTVDDVPVGTYYVRLRAINAVGSSAPSPEQEVVIQ